MTTSPPSAGRLADSACSGRAVDGGDGGIDTGAEDEVEASALPMARVPPPSADGTSGAARCWVAAGMLDGTLEDPAAPLEAP